MGGLLTLPAVWMLTGVLVGRSSARSIAQPLALIVVALGTPMWFYSMTFWEHAPAVCLATWSVAFCTRFISSGTKRDLALSALLCGLSVYLRDELYLLGGVLAAVSLTNGRNRWHVLSVFAGTFVLSLVPLWAFNVLALGHVFGFHFAAGSVFEVGLIQHLAERGRVIGSLLLNNHDNTGLSVVLGGPYLLLWLTYPSVRDELFRPVVVLLAGLAALGGVAVMAGYLNSGSPVWWCRHANGLFAVTPILVLAFVRRRAGEVDGKDAARVQQNQRIRRALWLAVLLYTLLYTLLTPSQHATGIHWGCRYLLLVYPLLGAMASVTLAEWWVTSRGRPGFGPLIVCLSLSVTVAAQAYSLSLLHGRKKFSAALNRMVAQQPQEVLLATGWFVPQELAQSFYEKEIFLIRDHRHGDELISVLRRAGRRDALFVGWPPAPDAATSGSTVLDDGDLNFISVEMRPVPLTE
jgi:hypothetical protein